MLVSDLHLGAGMATGARYGRRFAEQFHDDSAFAAMLALQRSRSPFRLVLLGDTVDFLHAPVTGRRTRVYARDDSDALGQLAAVCSAHPLVVAALAETAAQGRLDVVVGNHDPELARPAVQQQLRRLFGNHVHVQPFVLHVPGVLHAQHGHHHHDINAPHDPLHPVGRDGVAERPPAARAHALGAVAGRPGLLGRELLAGLRSHRHQPGPVEASGGLAAEVVGELVALSATGTRRMLLRLARKALHHEGSSVPPYGVAVAERVRAVLERHGQGVPLYVFGHTHAAELRDLGGAWYANTGTWSCDVRGRDGARLTWVEAEGGRASLWRWGAGPELLAGTEATVGV